MTVLVGVLCSDGVVIGADSIATSAIGMNPLVQLQTNGKIQILSDQVIVAATGAIGFSQRLNFHVEQAIKGDVFKNLKINECTTNISKRFLTDCAGSMVQQSSRGLGFGALLAAFIQGEPRLIEYGTQDFQPEIKKDALFFVSMGSGQMLADPFLAFISRVLWKDAPPTVEQGKFGVYWALDHAIKLAPGGVGAPIKLSVLSQVNGAWVASLLPDTQEQAQYIVELEGHIGSFARATIEDAEATPPPIAPKMPA
ncbi:hypothetical protein [Mesorhizobium sp. M0047]|uniref:hypothetical protein n=1 Tax=Mesorhizobium sp. M0047 TaxID=2956859 RepID=UPI00333ADD46